VDENMTVKGLAPILIVNSIEPVLPFWERLGFTRTTTVPETEPYTFAIVASGGTEVMLQTRASGVEDMGAEMTRDVRASVLYLTVGAIDAVLAALGEPDIALPRRTTFYGADELWVRDPGGNIVGFAAFPSTENAGV
jgi:uncharacterized glyoxalase superfamily protein PhnB